MCTQGKKEVLIAQRATLYNARDAAREARDSKVGIARFPTFRPLASFFFRWRHESHRQAQPH